MKLVYKKEQYKRYSKYRIRKSTRRKKRFYNPNKYHAINENILKDPFPAPDDFRLTNKPESCLKFFEKIRDKNSLSRINGRSLIQITLKDVQEIDYGAISILMAITIDMKNHGILLRGDSPDNEDALQFLIDSGYYNILYDNDGKHYPKTEKASIIDFEKGNEKISHVDAIRISDNLRKIRHHLTGKDSHATKLKTLILESCGNSIEWGKTKNNQWMLGIKYEKDKVIMTVTDVGLGILKSINRKFSVVLKDVFTNKSDVEILHGAFKKKYGSTTEEENRNKGLPTTRVKNENGEIKNLIVITNNVLLDFSDMKKSCNLKNSNFAGTFYQWEVDNSCFK